MKFVDCKHKHKTLCQHTDPDWWVGYQCDDCGLVLADDVTYEQIRGGHNLPWVDERLAKRAIAVRVGVSETQQERTLAFFGKAIRR